ncbi:MAG: polyprenyl synthetase family protein, partial [Cyclobacteriaceae bacterium]|nr:polyprenyl synthetase family protein [Cyclobacteriaceae bacterium]
DPQDGKHLYEFGISMGIGFQIMDDLLDVFADSSKFGKQVGGDIIADKKTLLLVKALSSKDKKTVKELKELLGGKEKDPTQKVKKVTAIYEHLGIKKIVEEQMNHYFEKAHQSLKKVNAPLHKKALLKNLSDSLMIRER